MTYRLNVNKSKFYALAKHYWPEICSMKYCEFIKYYRTRSYALNFRSGDHCWHRMFLSTCCGRVLLADEWEDGNDDFTVPKRREVHRLSLDELKEYGMLEEVPEKKEA